MTNTGNEASQIQPLECEHWQQTVATFRQYLAGCRAWLDQYPKTAEAAPLKAGKGLGLAKDAANARSEHIYLLSNRREGECFDSVPASTGYRPALWASMDEVETVTKRTRKAA
jgi:hypothetical protein